jgi:acetyltransferase-like isoleucine patch superfamily enzyme
VNRHETAILLPGVLLEGDYDLGPFVLVGETPHGRQPGELATLIGEGARIRSHTVLYAGNRIGRHFQTGHGALVREENVIGDDVSIGSGSIVEHHVRIGNRVRLHSHVFVPEFTVLEDDCWLGPNVVLTNARYPRSLRVKEQLAGPHVERGARLGANVTVLPGVRIGAEALVGAGAVVTKDVPPRAVVVGNPARVINDLSHLPYGDSNDADTPR